MSTITTTKFRRVGRNSVRVGDYHSDVRSDAEYEALSPPAYEVAGLVDYRTPDGHDLRLAVLVDATAGPGEIPGFLAVDVDDANEGSFYREVGKPVAPDLSPAGLARRFPGEWATFRSSVARHGV